MTETMKHDYPEIKSLNEKPTKLMIFLHGVGSDGNDLISLVPYIQKSLREYHFVSPHGIEEYDMAPFGRQWFSLQDRSPETIIKLAKNNAPKIQEQIEYIQKKLDIDNSNTVLFGFSQGTMMGIYLTLIQDKPYKAVLGFSGRLIPPPTLKNNSTPICIVHGEEDDIVEVDESRKLAEYCKQNSIDHKLLTIPNLAHSIDGKGIEFVIDFLKNLQ